MLSSNPPGNNIDSGDGDDKVYAGAGADTIAVGREPIRFPMIPPMKAVTVDLATQTVSGGYASGDVISGFENVEGSILTILLSGSAGDNLITGGAGADTIDGRGGVDTASYTTSETGVNRRSVWRDW